MTYYNIRLNYFKWTFVALLSLMVMACAPEVPSISPQKAADMFTNKQAIIVDVREQDEWNKQHIDGAILIPLETLESNIGELAKYKDSPIIMQCRSGKRSKKASQSLIKAGFTQVKNLEGGIIAWDKAGLETVKSSNGSK